MDSSLEEVGSPEETILALLDFLVDPLLPSKSCRGIITPSDEELVAKQVHAVVLLYNYYHRKQHPELEFLDFEPFCKMAVALKPSLLSYMKVDDFDKQLTLTEKTVINGCDLCKSLDALNNKPVLGSWPITKIAVLLVDSKKENFYMFHSSITQGVWSIIEKDVDESYQRSEAVTLSRTRNKKSRLPKNKVKEIQTANEASLHCLAWLAVKEACGINQDDLITLEKHVVCSIDKGKTAISLYIMQCTQTNGEAHLVPINDAIESLKGPLVKKESGSWITTPAVEYFHLLPFACTVLDWLSREGLVNNSECFEAPKDDGNCRSSDRVESLPYTSESHEMVEVTNVENSYSEVIPLANTSNHVQAVREIQDHSSQFVLDPDLNTSQSFIEVREVENQNSPQLELKEVLNTMDQIETVKEDENCKSSHLEVEPPLNTAQSIETTKEVEDCTNSHFVVVEPLPNVSEHIEAEKVVENDKSQLREEKLFNTSQSSMVVTEGRNGNSNQLNGLFQNPSWLSELVDLRKSESTETVVYKKRKKLYKNSNSKIFGQTSNTATQFPKPEDKKCVSGSLNNMDIDEFHMTCSSVDEKSKIHIREGCDDNQKQIILAEETGRTALTEGADIVADIIDHLPKSDEQHVDKLTIASKETSLSQTPLKALLQKREILSQQHRIIADELALCDRSLKTILSGSEENLGMKLDSVIENCNDICLRSFTRAETRICQHFSSQEFCPVMKRKRLSEAVLFVHKPCQVAFRQVLL